MNIVHCTLHTVYCWITYSIYTLYTSHNTAHCKQSINNISFWLQSDLFGGQTVVCQNGNTSKHEYFYMPLVILDNHMVWGENSLKMSALWLKGFGIYDVLKIWRKRMTDLINKSINQLMTKVFVEQLIVMCFRLPNLIIIAAMLFLLKLLKGMVLYQLSALLFSVLLIRVCFLVINLPLPYLISLVCG